MSDFNNNAPKVGEHFKQAAEGRQNHSERSGEHNSHGGSSDISTAAELQKLESERQVPNAAPQLTPSGVQTRDVNQRLNDQRENRIDHLQDRLNKAQDRFERNFERSK